VAWDSNVVIDCLEKEKSARYEWVKPILLDAEADKVAIVISSIAIAETTRIDGRDMHIENKVVQDFFDEPYIDLHAAHRAIALIAREIRTHYDVDGADSIHLATAVFNDVPVFLTNDGDSKRQRNKKKNPTPLLPLDKLIVIKSGHLRVMTPKQYDEMARDAAQPLVKMALELSATTVDRNLKISAASGEDAI
jgi:predicted nucleic acid-binding protein